MKKEFQSPYHALTAQAEALVQLLDAIRNAEKHCLHLHVKFKKHSGKFQVPDKIIVEAMTGFLCEYDEDEVPVPETTEWDISFLFRSNAVRETGRFCLWLSDTSD